MAGPRGEVSFEVHILQSGQWQIHGRYSEQKQRAAIQDAKSLELISTITAVKVVKEIYDEKTGLSNEIDVFKSQSLKEQEAEKREKQPKKQPSRTSEPPPKRSQQTASKAKKSAKQKPSKAAKGTEASPCTPAEPEKRKKKGSFFAAIIKLLFAVLVSLVLATLVMQLGSMMLSDRTAFGVRMTAGLRSNILIGVWLVSFLLSAGSMVMAFIKKGHLDLSLGGGKSKAPAAAPPKPAAAPPRPAETQPAATVDRPAEPLPVSAVAEDVVPLDTGLSVEGEKQKVFMMEFLSDSLQKVKAQKETMDKYNLFGVNMYLAGACDALGQERKLDVLTASLILGESVEAMGFKKAQADSFADRFVEYLVADSRYMQMYQAGRNAMNTSLGGDAGGTDQLEKALAEWNKPKPKEEKAGPVTVMFTDMVGSTQLTQTRGDEVAQQVVRAHNRIVRDALNRYAGREIKHTGDGIMASFAITSNNLEAAVFIQRQAAVHTKANADLPLHLKIGINAGEPIVEDDDLFGTTVQVAARIVDKAKSEEIFVSEIVHGICAGKDFRFVNRGQFEMKGVQEPLTLYEAVWDESRVVEVAETEAEKAKAEGAEEPPEEEKPEEIAEEEKAPAADEKPKEPAEPAEPAAAKEAAPDEKPAEAAGEAAAPRPAAAPPPEAPKGSPEGAAKPQGAKVPLERETTAAPTAPPRQPAEAAKDKA